MRQLMVVIISFGAVLSLGVLGVLASGATAIAQSGSAGGGALKQDVFLKCSVNINGIAYVPRNKFRALADNLSDPDFANFDPTCKGKKANPEGVAMAAKKKLNATDRYVNDMNTIVADRSANPEIRSDGVPATVLRKDFGMEKSAAIPFLFRDAYSTYSLLSPPPPKEKATGTQVSYTQDYLNHNDVFSGVGAIIGWNVWEPTAASGNFLGSWGITRGLFAPGVEFDEVRNHADKTKNMDYVGFRVIGEIEKETPGGLFPLQYFRYSPYFKTDSQFSSKIVGNYFEWEPYRLELAIGVSQRLFGSPVQFRWSPVLHAEAEKVVDAGSLTSVHTGDDYLRFGPVLEGDIFFAEGPLERLVLTTQYRYLWNVADTGRAHDISYFQQSAAYNLDASGNIAVSVTYRDGNSPSNNTRVRDLKAGITIKN